jgi:HAE1 family hydrophobic/amphiphilic exporter-1
LATPLSVLAALPMALVGAIGGLLIAGEDMTMVAMIGTIMLVGLVGKNAILLVDYIGTLRRRGVSRSGAILQAGTTRLRAILMTTLTIVFAMLPIALRYGRGAEIRAPMAITVLGGLAVSTILTLVMVPVVYTYIDDVHEWFLGGRSRRDPPEIDTPVDGHPVSAAGVGTPAVNPPVGERR